MIIIPIRVSCGPQTWSNARDFSLVVFFMATVCQFFIHKIGMPIIVLLQWAALLKETFERMSLAAFVQMCRTVASGVLSLVAGLFCLASTLQKRQ